MSEKIQFIGYGINTGPKNTGSRQIYLGLDDETADYKARVELIKQAAEKAAGDSATKAKALKIFTIPEFYFRGKNGAYELTTIMGEGTDNAGLIGALQETFMDAKWKNWLFVVGSIIGKSYPAKEKKIKVEDIIIPAYKPAGKNPTDEVEKPVDKDDLTVEERLRLTVLTANFKAEFKKDSKVKVKADTDSLAEDAAKKWVLNQAASIADADVKKLAEKLGAAADKDFAKIDSKKLDQYIEDNPFVWAAAADTSKATEAYNVVPVIEGGFETKEKAVESTHIVMKQNKSGIDFIKTTELDGDLTYYTAGTDDVVTDNAAGNDGVVNHLDDWGLVKRNGSVDTTKVAEIKKQKNYGELPAILGDNFVLLQYNDQVQNLDPVGVFRIGKLTFAVDVCLDHSEQFSKKMINAFNHADMKPILEKVLSKESIEVMKAAKKGVDVQLVPSCGMSIEENAAVAKKNGYIFNCDGLNGQRLLTNPNYHVLVDGSDNVLDTAGYKAAVATEKSIGNAHTGLMKVTDLDMDLANDSTLSPWDTKTKTKAVALGITSVTAGGNTTNITDLYWENVTTKYPIGGKEKGKADRNVEVTVNGPIGGVLHIYEEVDV